MGSLLPLPGPTVGLGTNSNTPTTTYYSWFKSLFDALKSVVATVADILALFPAGTSSAWTTYVPVLTSGGGTITTSSATGSYYQVGKIVFLNFTATITTVGTATGGLTVTLPVAATSARDQYIGGVEQTNDVAVTAQILASLDGKAHVLRYDGATILASTRVVVCAGFYEAA